LTVIISEVRIIVKTPFFKKKKKERERERERKKEKEKGKKTSQHGTFQCPGLL
jgi:hypothetical protein